MKVLRVKLNGWTASFRYPIFISGYQPTLPLPPISTIYGILSAAKGKLVTPVDTRVGFVFTSKGKTVDLETIYELGGNLKAKSNVIKREFLIDPELYLYIENLDFGEFFKRPHYQILIGRSSDLAMISSVEVVELAVRAEVSYTNTILPFNFAEAHGMVQSLPTHFTDEVPRKAQGTQIYYLLDDATEIVRENQLVDPEHDWGVYLHP